MNSSLCLRHRLFCSASPRWRSPDYKCFPLSQGKEGPSSGPEAVSLAVSFGPSAVSDQTPSVTLVHSTLADAGINTLGRFIVFILSLYPEVWVT